MYVYTHDFHNHVVKVWNTLDGSLFAEWKPSDGSDTCMFSSMTCVSTGKKVVLHTAQTIFHVLICNVLYVNVSL